MICDTCAHDHSPGRDEVAGYLAELKAIGRRIGQPIPAREPGDEVEVPF